MKLLNVRLGPKDARIASELKARGLKISTIVREALRARHLEMKPPVNGDDVDAILADIYTEHPAPPGPSEAAIDVYDRRSFQEYVRGRVALRR